MMAEPCFRCGNTEADTYRYCYHRKAFVCLNCEMACPEYSRKLLPNGTNCRHTYIDSGKKYIYLTNSEEVKASKEKYYKLNNIQLRERFKNLENAHNKSDNAPERAKLRVELAAVYEVIQERKGGHDT